MCFVPKYTNRFKENFTSSLRVPIEELLIVQGKNRITTEEKLWHNNCDIVLKASSIALNKLVHCLKKIIKLVWGHKSIILISGEADSMLFIPDMTI